MSCVFFTLGFSASAANGNATETLLKLLGYDVFVESFSETLRSTNNQIAGSDTRLAVAWELAASETFPANQMMDEIVSAMDGTLDSDHVVEATEFLSSELGVLVTNMEIEAQRPDESDRVDAQGEMNLNYAIYAGMSQSGKLPYQLSEAEILELVVSQQDMLRAHIRDKIYTMFAYTYRDLSDDQLSDYIGFLTSKAGTAVYGAIHVATEGVLSTRAQRFGNWRERWKSRDHLLNVVTLDGEVTFDMFNHNGNCG